MENGTVNTYANHYYSQGGGVLTTDGWTVISPQWSEPRIGTMADIGMQGMRVTGGIHPVLAFKYIKSKFGILEGIKINLRLRKLEKAFNKAVDNGQEALGEKFLKEISREARESMIWAKGCTSFIERDDLNKVKHKVRDGHISDTKLEDFMKVIPKDVMKKKKAVEHCFDGFVIYHYYNPDVEAKIEKKMKLTPDEHQKMKDPILFGYIKETNRLYFVADWEDEFCDLTFDELVDVVGESKLTRHPVL